MGVRGLIAAGAAGAAAFVIFKAARVGGASEPRIIYVSQPEEKRSGLAKVLGLLDLAAGIVDAGSGSRVFPTTGDGQPIIYAAGSAGSGSAPSSSSRGGISGLLSLIGGIEAPGGYDQVYGGSRIATPKPLTRMTVREVLDWQDRSIAAGSASSAVGRYQIIRGTLRGLVTDGAVSMGELFSPSVQDRLATHLMERRGLSAYQSGQISAQTFAQRLSQEWASLPAATVDRSGRAAAGQSYYAGDGLNKALTDLDTVISAIRSL